MAYRQYTQCTSPGNYIGAVAAQIIVAAAIGAIPLIVGLVAGALLAGPAALAALLIPLYAVIAYCRWWLLDRLICLGGDVCAVGRVLGVEPPEGKSGLDSFDTDYSINLLLAPHLIGATQADVESDGIQGNLIRNQPAIVALGVDWKGETSKVFSSDPESAVFHAEFEGGGVYDLMLACLAALAWDAAATVAAVIICSIPIIGWIACLIISLIFAAVTLAIVGIGIAVALGDKGNPNDVDSHLGNIEQRQDLLVVKGTWVYDSAHEGWNEIHPIKHCQRIGTWADSWDAAFDTIRTLVPAGVTVDAGVFAAYWCEAVAAAEDPLTIANQDDPKNHWDIHPDIDGCDPGDDDGDGDPPIPK